MARSVDKSARSGRFVTKAAMRRSPRTTVSITVGSKATGYRSAATGKFVSVATARRHPGTAIREG